MTQVNWEKAVALARQLQVDMGGALIMALCYLGDRLGVFQALADGRPLTVRELAERTGLQERYLLEWVSALAAAGYLDYDPLTATFRISPEQALVLLDESSPLYLAGTYIYAIACIRQLPALMEAFQRGGGVPFAQFGPEIVEGIEKMFRPGYERSVVQSWLAAVPDVEERLRQGGLAAEVGCGAGQALVPVAKAFPNSRFVGYDIDAYSIQRARARAREEGLEERLHFEQTPAQAMPADGRYDLVMAFNCIHDMADPKGALAAIRRSLKPTGAFLWSEAKASDRLEENATPMGRLLYAASCMHCLTVSLAGGGLGLGTVVGPEKARELALEAGFSSFQVLPVEHPFHRLFLLRP